MSGWDGAVTQVESVHTHVFKQLYSVIMINIVINITLDNVTH